MRFAPASSSSPVFATRTRTASSSASCGDIAIELTKSEAHFGR
jgi:hypothetical protein